MSLPDDYNQSDNHMQVFIGSDYKIGTPKTVGQLRSVLEEIAASLPEDDGLEISEVVLDSKKGTLGYTLKEGIPE